MTKQEIEKSAKAYFKDLPCPEDYEIATFVMLQINKALEQAAKLTDDGDAMPGMADAIRRLKVAE